MRDPERIPRILEKIGELWATYPDLRLGQLVVNLVKHTEEVYDVEDEALESAIALRTLQWAASDRIRSGRGVSHG